MMIEDITDFLDCDWTIDRTNGFRAEHLAGGLIWCVTVSGSVLEDNEPHEEGNIIRNGNSLEGSEGSAMPNDASG